jgi:tRNA A37 threonylcarbamoyladenosine dehydratase
MDRFLRTRRFLGEEKFAILQTKKVTIIGLGAVGSYACEAVTRFGILNIRAVDFDIIKHSNINRQLYALESTLGEYKADVCQNRVRDINPSCQIETLKMFAHEESFEMIFNNQPDIVIDAIDSLSAKVALLTWLYRHQIPVVSSMGAALKFDPSRITTGDIFDTDNCHLARMMRKRLRRNGVGRGIDCVFSTEIVNNDSLFYETNPEDLDRGRKRNALGSLPTITGIFGLTLANLAVRKLLQLSTEVSP